MSGPAIETSQIPSTHEGGLGVGHLLGRSLISETNREDLAARFSPVEVISFDQAAEDVSELLVRFVAITIRRHILNLVFWLRALGIPTYQAHDDDRVRQLVLPLVGALDQETDVLGHGEHRQYPPGRTSLRIDHRRGRRILLSRSNSDHSALKIHLENSINQLDTEIYHDHVQIRRGRRTNEDPQHLRVETEERVRGQRCSLQYDLSNPS